MRLEELKTEIPRFKKEVVAYKKFLEVSADCMGEIDFDNDKLSDLRSGLVKKYAVLEKYIKVIGQDPKTHDGVWATLYSVYDNGFSADILARVLPSIGGVLTDLDYISGKLETLTEQEFEDKFNKQPTSSKPDKAVRSSTNYWNYVNPFWLIWKLLSYAWQHLFASFVVTVVGGVMVIFLARLLKWM